MFLCKSYFDFRTDSRGRLSLQQCANCSHIVLTNCLINQNLKSRTHTVSPYEVCANTNPALVIHEGAKQRTRARTLTFNGTCALTLERSAVHGAKNLARWVN